VTAALEPQYLTIEKLPETNASEAIEVRELGRTSTVEEIPSKALLARVVTPSGIVNLSTPKFWKAA
jgi:hypothetical protein